jgi:hypothetical protein
MVCSFGPREAACGIGAALLGGDVRVGFENNLALPDGSLAPDNRISTPVWNGDGGGPLAGLHKIIMVFVQI